ncbi:MAG: TRAP transporter small permease [Pseudomonadota bacterium]
MTLRTILYRLEEWLLAALLCAMTLLSFVQVVLRYGFNSGILWALEANFYLFGWLVLLGISYGVRTRAHIGVDALVRLLPVPMRRAVGLLVTALAITYTCLMLYGSWVYISRLRLMGVEAEDIPVERWILSSCLVIGFALLLYRLLGMGWRILSGQSIGYELADEAHDAIRDVGGDSNPDATAVSR